MQAPQSKVFAMANRGLVQRLDPSVLQDGQFQSITNLMSLQEGALVSDFGSKLLGKLPSGATLPHPIRKLSISSDDSYNLRYVGETADIYRTTDYATFTKVNAAAVLDSGNAAHQEKKWSMQPYKAGSSGDPYAYFATPKYMLRDHGSSPHTTLRRWGIVPPARGADVSVLSARSVNIGPSTTQSPTLDLGANYITVSSSALDMSSFSGSPVLPSGRQATGYSNDDYVQVVVDISDSSASPDLSKLTELKIQFSVHDNTFAAYYEGAIDFIPSGAAVTLASITATLKIPKSSFLAMNGAGAVGVDTYNWKDVKAVRVYANAATASVFTVTLATNSVTFNGGSGPSTMGNNAGPYDYRFVFRNPATGEVSNPCIAMPSWAYVYADRQPVQVTVYGTDDPNIPTSGNSIAVYRRGGVYTDGYYRLVGYVANPGLSGAVPASANFTDIASDADIQYAAVMEFDNDPPVPSGLPSPIEVTLGAIAFGWQNVNVGVSGVTPGTSVHVQSVVSSDYDEDCIVWSVSSTTITLFFRNARTSGDKLIISTICGQPCHLVMQMGDSLLVAGDPNNRHYCYQSKSGRPGSFPFKNLESGAVKVTTAGNPGNPIMNFCEFNSEVVFLLASGIAVSGYYNGYLSNATMTPAQRGLWATHAWAKGENELWYLAYDGVYSWNGGVAVKRSEAIDAMFHGRTLNGIPPIDMSEKSSMVATFANSTFHLLYQATDNGFYELVYEVLYDRWRIRSHTISAGAVYPTTIYAEEDTGRLIIGKYDTSGGRLSEADLDSSDGSGEYAAIDWAAGPTGGSPVPFSVRTPEYVLAGPFSLALLQDLIVNVQNPDAALTVKVFYNGSSTADSVDQFTIPTSSTLRPVPLPLQRTGGTLSTYGKLARTASLEFSSAGGVRRTKITHVAFNHTPIAELQSGKAYDWNAHGWDFDKRMVLLKVEYDNRDESGTAHDITLVVDTQGGPHGATTNLAAASWVLPASIPGRNKVSLPFPKDVVAKLTRMRPLLAPNQAQPAYNVFAIIDFSYEYERYPADVISNTEYRDGGSPYDKYWQQLLLDVNTNGQNVTVSIDVDGTILGTTYVINTTISTRNVNITLPPLTKGKKARAIVDVSGMSSTALFQLFNHDWITLPADKGPVLADYDFDDLGWPHDKKLQRVTIWYEQGTPASNVIIQMDVIEGINGTTVTVNKQQFILTGTGRAQQSFLVIDGTVVKAVSMHPTNNDKNFRMWKYQFDKIDYPPDIAEPGEWDNLGWPCEKILRAVDIDVDTGGVAASVQIQADGSNIGSPFSITTTSNDRNRHISFAPNLIGRRFRDVPTPGGGGKYQRFGIRWDVVREPCPLSNFDTYEQTFGYMGWKFLKQGWVEYMCAAAITLLIYRDGGVLFRTITLPAHPYRDIERFSLPDIDSVTQQYNQSKVYRMNFSVASAATPFKIYPGGTFFEWKPVNGDQRAGYSTFNLSEMLLGPGKI